MVSAANGLDDDWFIVLNTIVLKKSSTVEALAAPTGLAPDAVSRIVGYLTEEGHVLEFDGLVMPDDSATEAVKKYNEERYGDIRGQSDVAYCHQRFEELNELMLKAIDAWQQVKLGGSKIPNDHLDVTYDDKVISRIDGIISKLDDVLGKFGQRAVRFHRYPPRFEAAMNKVEADRRFISDPRVESVHNIWFELHEDILFLLGKERVN